MEDFRICFVGRSIYFELCNWEMRFSHVVHQWPFLAGEVGAFRKRLECTLPILSP